MEGEDSITNLDSKFWENRYLNNETGWDIGNISTPLKEYFDQLSNIDLKIIIPGCGNAYEAEYLFNLGFKNIFLVDYSQTALNQFSNRVPNFPKTQLICENFFNHDNHYDLMVEQTFFCAIDPSLRQNYVKHCSKILYPNGKLVGVLFNDTLNIDKPPFGGNISEYKKLFTPHFNIEKMEKAYNSIEPRKDRELFIKLTCRNA